MSRWDNAQADEVRQAAAEVAIHAHALDIHEVLNYLDTRSRSAFSAVTIADLRYAHERIGAILAYVDPKSTVDGGGRST